ncbi:MAG: hypothetical protein JJW01_02435 [Alphaproteobacteria bacterium]|nr:hypothetical protein [Rickettsiales bacterium]
MPTKKKEYEDAIFETPHPSQSSLIGHKNILHKLLNILCANKSHHAIIINGKKGIGKATLVYTALKMCLQEYDQKLNQNKDSIAMMLSRTHPDILILEDLPTQKKDKKDISIDQIRAMIEFAQLTPSYLNKKYIIIDPIDSLNNSSANALLKILEEPPATVQFIMTCNKLKSTIQTVISRCIVLHCKPNTYQNCITILNSLNIKKDVNDIELIMQISGYNVATAIEIIRSDAVRFYKALLLDISNQYNTCEKLLLSIAKNTYYPHILQHFTQRILTNISKMSANVINEEHLAIFEIEFFEKYLNTKYPTPLEMEEKINKCINIFSDSEIFKLSNAHLTQTILHIIRK